MENIKPTTEILTCLLSMRYERGLGQVVRKGDGTYLAHFKGRNARGRAMAFFKIESDKLKAAKAA
jgi:hypothetical protein